MQTIWKDIQGYEGYYQISNTGLVKSLKRITSNNRQLQEKILKNKKDSKGYLFVILSNGKSVKSKWIARLVATEFIENKENKPCVNHIDNNTINNNSSNLEWVTKKENSEHAVKQDRIAKNETSGKHKLSNQDVLEIRKLKGLMPQRKIALKFGVGKSVIGQILLNQIRKL